MQFTFELPQLLSGSLSVTLHGVSGNRVNARTRHVITRSHANGMTLTVQMRQHGRVLFP